MDRVSIINSLAQAVFRVKPAYYDAEHFLAVPGVQIQTIGLPTMSQHIRSYDDGPGREAISHGS